MNIEEERKAFRQCTALDSKVNNHEFGFWLKAKAHAVELAKPVAEVYERMDDRFWAVKEGSRNNVCDNGSTFDCYADAEQCAIERGYRVVE